MSDVLYLYGFVSQDAVPVPRALSGVDGARVDTVDVGDVRAVVSAVPADEFSPAVIDANIQDLNWVGARGLEHERVVAWFVDNADILPVSLFTLYSGERALREALASRAAELSMTLRRLADHREWDLKVAYDDGVLTQHAAAVSESVREIDAAIAEAAPGRRFLLDKKRRDIVRHEITSAARAQARSLLEEISEHAVSAVTLPMSRNEELPVVLNAAVLVHKTKEPAMREAAARRVAALESIGIHARLTGPWAPYRFMEEADASA
jgi:hypothetical protein